MHGDFQWWLFNQVKKTGAACRVWLATPHKEEVSTLRLSGNISFLSLLMGPVHSTGVVIVMCDLYKLILGTKLFVIESLPPGTWCMIYFFYSLTLFYVPKMYIFLHSRRAFYCLLASLFLGIPGIFLAVPKGIYFSLCSLTENH